MQEQRPQNFVTTNLLKCAFITLALLGLLDRANILSLDKGFFGRFTALIFAIPFMGVAMGVLNERDIPEPVSQQSSLLTKLSLFSQRAAAIRSPKTVDEGAAKGLLCGGLLALILLKNKGPDFNLILGMAFLGAAIGFKNAMNDYWRPARNNR